MHPAPGFFPRSTIMIDIRLTAGGGGPSRSSTRKVRSILCSVF